MTYQQNTNESNLGDQENNTVSSNYKGRKIVTPRPKNSVL